MTIYNYNFEGPFTSTHDLLSRPGVYVILSSNGTTYKAIDVGESHDIRSRIESHDRKECWKRNAPGTLLCAVHYTPYQTESARRVIEIEVRKSINPTCGSR